LSYNVEKNSLADQVAEKIRKMILVGEIKLGERLVEEKLAKKMDVSRGPVRAAFQILENIGLVKNKPYKGSSVIEMKEKNVKELYTMILLVSKYAIKEAITKAKKEEIEEAKKILENKREAFYENDIIKYTECDCEFSQIVIDMAHHKLLNKMYSVLKGQIMLFEATAFRKRKFSKFTEKYLEEQEEIISGLEKGEEDRVVQIFETHYDRWHYELLNSIED